MMESAVRIEDLAAHSAAWVLPLGNGLHAAVGGLEMRHLLKAPALFEIPASPLHCRHVCIWNEALLPVMDLNAWLTGQATRQESPLVGVVGYECLAKVAGDSAHAVQARAQLGGLLLDGLPKRLFVSEDQACALPEGDLDWREISISCFTDEGGAGVPILDLSRIFSDALNGADTQRAFRG